MPTTKQPQDRKAKQSRHFTFKALDGAQHTLPPADQAREKLSGADFEDALLAGEIGQLTYLVKCLRASGASQDALDALRAMPQTKYVEILSEWGDHGDGDGASLGE